jgi:hypothetical protein
MTLGMRFVISIYGDEFVPFLAVCLRSLRLTHPDDQVSVLFDDVHFPVFERIVGGNPNVSFLPTSTPASKLSNRQQRVPAKLEQWAGIMRSGSIDYGDLIVFIDVDTIVTANIAEALPLDFDLLFTWREAKVPINTGVIVVRQSEIVTAFFEEWRDLTRQIYEHPEQLREARQRNGAASQDALWQLMGGPQAPFEKSIEVDFPFGRMRFVGAPCSVLNQVDLVPTASGARIYHYKGGWHTLLLKGRVADESWPWSRAVEMHRLWQQYRKDEEKHLGIPLLPLRTRVRDLGRRWGLRLSKAAS